MREIKFLSPSATVDAVIEPPVPAKLLIPEWYKKIPNNQYQKNPEFDDFSNVVNKSVKSCMPFLDSLTTGYIQKLHTDVYISYEKDKINYHFPSKPIPLEHRGNVSTAIDDSFYQIEFVWKMYWTFLLPEGYSAIVTHPWNRNELPFVTLTGIIDSDNPQKRHYITSPEEGGNIPMYIKNRFTGLIPAGTPIYQIIPFKRESWKSSKEEYNEKTYLKHASLIWKKFWHAYKDNLWQKKDFS